MPSAARVCGSYDPLREDEVDGEEQDHPSGHEDLCSNGDSDISWSGCPDYAHDTGRDAGHAEAERHPRHDELVPSLIVQLEYSHVGHCAADEEEQEHRGDWDIGMNGWGTAQAGGLGRIGTMLCSLLLRASAFRGTSPLSQSVSSKSPEGHPQAIQQSNTSEGKSCNKVGWGLTCLGSRKSIG